MQDQDPNISGSKNEKSSSSGVASKRQSFKVGGNNNAAADASGDVGDVPPAAIAAPPESPDVTTKMEKVIEGMESCQQVGRRPGDRYIRMTKANLEEAENFEYGLQFSARENAAPLTSLGRSIQRTKRFLLGKPLTNSQAIHERLSKVQALAILSSDALSSVAYATEEILLVLVIIATAPLDISIWLALAIAGLLIIVATSYRQTIEAYPKGGGSYIVAKDNLGETPGLVAAASLMIDYILTVAVSVSAGVAAVTSAFPTLNDFTVELCILFIAIIGVLNLRGISESGSIFTAPTYLFIFTFGTVLFLGFVKVWTGWSIAGSYQLTPGEAINQTETLSVFIILRAFASGCTALTGVEAISDGVPAFKKPEWKNAQTTLTWMVAILVTLFLATTFLAHFLSIVPREQGTNNYETVVSMIGHLVVGDSPIYYLLQAATALILVLAANTCFSDFPRLTWFLARDKYLPHLFSHRGDRLAFSTGIVTLSVLSAILVSVYGGKTSALIPLYAVGVFLSFTLSQSGMVVRWWRLKTPGWRKRLTMNAAGAFCTLVVLLIIGSTKFLAGAWMVICLIPLIYLMLKAIHRHYDKLADQVSLAQEEQQIVPLEMDRHKIVVPINDLNQVTRRTLSYARALDDDVTAVHVNDNSEDIANLRERWDASGIDIPLVIIETPYRAILGPFLTYIDTLRKHDPQDTITVVIPEFVQAHWWQWFLHNQTALRLKASLLLRPGVVVTSVPYHLAARKA